MLNVDVAVIGAGILGCLVAQEISERNPATSVAIIERDMVGSGASRRSAGLHFPRGATETVREMSRFSQQYWTELAASQPGLPIFALPMTLVASRGQAAQAKSAYLSEAKLRPIISLPQLQSGLPADSVGWTVDGCHYADVHQLTQQLAETLRGRVQLIEGVRVTALEPGEDGVGIELGTGQRVQADKVVLSPGPWLAEPAWNDLVTPLGARVKKVVAMHIARRPAPEDQAISFHDEDAFLLPMARRGHWLFSYTCQEWDVDPDRLSTELSELDLATARGILQQLAPELLPYCTGGRVFCDAYSPDREPIITSLDAAGRIVFAGACNGAGYRLAPAIAARAAALVRSPILQGSTA